MAHIQQKTKVWIQTRVGLIRLWPLYTTPAYEVIKLEEASSWKKLLTFKIFIPILYCFIQVLQFSMIELCYSFFHSRCLQVRTTSCKKFEYV